MNAFERRNLEGLPPTDLSAACGVYAIYYNGTCSFYENLSADKPIYVGKAVAPGGRKGGGDLELATGNLIVKRLREHSKSIATTKNLRLSDFQCRWLTVNPHFANAAEAMLIDFYKPVWNVVVTGFGIHDPGAGRYSQARSDWDVLHPGRGFALKCAEGNSPAAILKRLKANLK